MTTQDPPPGGLGSFEPPPGLQIGKVAFQGISDQPASGVGAVPAAANPTALEAVLLRMAKALELLVEMQHPILHKGADGVIRQVVPMRAMATVGLEGEIVQALRALVGARKPWVDAKPSDQPEQIWVPRGIITRAWAALEAYDALGKGGGA